jgi:hypothetical protein
MKNGRFTFHERVLPGLGVLTPAERKAVRAKVAALAGLPAEQWSRRGVVQITPEEPLYLVRIDESLRIILRERPGERPEVEDIVRHETLHWFRAAEHAGHA